MLITAIVLFLIAALGGAYMAAKIFGGKQPPMGVAMLHGLLAATGLVLVIWYFVTTPTPPSPVGVGLGILVLAALGGFYLFSKHLAAKPHPRGVVVIHALAAVCGVGTLAYALL